MKLGRTGSTPAPRAASAASPSDASASSLTAGVAGIPENEFTPNVRAAIVSLMEKVESLRHELQATLERLEEAKQNADQDQLLPLLNRRAFVRELTRQIALTGRHGIPASLIYFDLNDFKAINDSIGHTGGDAVLKQLASVLKANVRDTDRIGRLGGDEFGVLLGHADQAQAHVKADLLAKQLHDSPTIWNGKKISLSFAYGAFELRAGDNAELAIARADEAMYAHKRRAE
jgi:diguanylate cyclase (GGDEF)-like protein